MNYITECNIQIINTVAILAFKRKREILWKRWILVSSCDEENLTGREFLLGRADEWWWGKWNKQRWCQGVNVHNAFRREDMDTSSETIQ